MSSEWNAAIEAAAKVADQEAGRFDLPGLMALHITTRIRALRRPEAARCDCGCQVHAIECDRKEAEK